MILEKSALQKETFLGKKGFLKASVPIVEGDKGTQIVGSLVLPGSYSTEMMK